MDEFREGLSYGAHEMRDGVNVSRQRQLRPLVLPTELINLKDREGYFCMAKGYPVAKGSFEYTDWKIRNEKLLEALPVNQVNVQVPASEKVKIEGEQDTLSAKDEAKDNNKPDNEVKEEATENEDTREDKTQGLF